MGNLRFNKSRISKLVDIVYIFAASKDVWRSVSLIHALEQIFLKMDREWDQDCVRYAY